jgi:hypothetical protein
MVIEKLPGFGLKRLFSLGFLAILWRFKPGIKGTATHFHHAAQYGNWISLLLLPDKPVFYPISLGFEDCGLFYDFTLHAQLFDLFA